MLAQASRSRLSLTSKPPMPEAHKAPVLEPPQQVKYLAWVRLPDGRCGYIDHYKTDGKFGVRPVDFVSGLHYPNTSTHWSMEDREKIPEEIVLRVGELRPAEVSEIPAQYRNSVHR